MNKFEYIKIIIPAGDTREDAIRQTINTCLTYECDVVFTFNGKDYKLKYQEFIVDMLKIFENGQIKPRGKTKEWY